MSYVFDEMKENNQFQLLFTDELSKVSDEWRLCILATTPPAAAAAAAAVVLVVH